GLLGTGPASANQGQSAPALAYVLVVAACLPVAVRRWRPLWTFVLTGAATMTYLALGYAYGPILFPLVVACYGLAVRAPIRRTLAGTAALLATSGVAVGIGVVTGQREWLEFGSVAAWLVIPAAVGVAVKVRLDAAAEVRAEQARRAVSEERLRLAQEVHDVVGHGLAVIAMQAGVALRVLDGDPARARAALEAIRGTSREALDGLRAEIDALRGRPEQPEAPLRPHPGLADLPALGERIRAGGLPVTVEIDRGTAGLPVEIDRAAYRIVQESLTNVLRHSGPAATARVRVAQDGGVLRVEVLDTGRGATDHGATDPAGRAAGRGDAGLPRDVADVPGDVAGLPAGASGGGHGIDGMRTRALALGGTLDAGPLPGGGFAVRACLPMGEHSPTPGGPL
ncbi:MAG TPA: sensor histidine kinase, partial [Pilimelia sp.]|nr:sensor histidine kinase [Pilimelia sp.]